MHYTRRQWESSYERQGGLVLILQQSLAEESYSWIKTTRLYYSNSRLRGKIWHEYTAEIGKLLPLVYESFIRPSDFHWRSGSSSLLLSLVGTKLQWIWATLKHLQLHSCQLTHSYASRVPLAEEPLGHHSEKDFYGTVIPEQAA